MAFANMRFLAIASCTIFCCVPVILVAQGPVGARPTGQWIADSQGCKVWNPNPKPNESISWSGTCKNGFAEGEGTLQWFLEGQSNGSNVGNFQSGKQIGRGIATTSKGSRYEGEFIDGKRVGKGTLFFANGDRLDGEFRDSRLIGEGLITRGNGEKFFVNERDGKLLRVPNLVQNSSGAEAAPSVRQSDSTSSASSQTSVSTVKWNPVTLFPGELFPSFIIATATMKQPPGTESSTYLGDLRGSIGITVTTTKPDTRLDLRVEIDNIADPTTFSTSLAQPGAYRVFPKIRYRYAALTNTNQPMTVNATWSLTVNGEFAGSTSEALRVRSVNDVPFAVRNSAGKVISLSWMFAAFVNEEHPWIDPLLREALRTGKTKAFSGYQRGPQDVLQQVDAVWTALRRRGITYSSITTNSAASDKVLSQHVRFLSESVRYTQANCIDGTVLLASVFRKIGIDPFIVLVPGHAFLGLYTDASKKQAIYLETTMLGQYELRSALAEGANKQRKLATAAADPRVQIVDIEKARQLGIVPIAR